MNNEDQKNPEEKVDENPDDFCDDVTEALNEMAVN